MNEEYLNFVCEDCYVLSPSQKYDNVPPEIGVTMPKWEAIRKGWKQLPSTFDGRPVWFCPKHGFSRMIELGLSNFPDYHVATDEEMRKP